MQGTHSTELSDLESCKQLGLVSTDNKRNKLRLTDEGIKWAIDFLIKNNRPEEAYLLAMEYYGPGPVGKTS